MPDLACLSGCLCCSSCSNAMQELCWHVHSMDFDCGKTTSRLQLRGRLTASCFILTLHPAAGSRSWHRRGPQASCCYLLAESLLGMQHLLNLQVISCTIPPYKYGEGWLAIFAKPAPHWLQLLVICDLEVCIQSRRQHVAASVWSPAMMKSASGHLDIAVA